MNDSISRRAPLASAPLLLIDGYNLLYATDIIGQGSNAGTLQASRQALLDFLVDTLREDLLERTIIVFDAKDPPPGLPRQVKQGELQIHYATGFPNADQLLKEYIEIHTAPRQLLVVSSDHEVQRAARRRRATSVDSDVWYRKVRSQQNDPHSPRGGSHDKPAGPPSAVEVQRWMEEFGTVSEELETATEATDSKGPGPPAKKNTAETNDISNPFPPGYADDLLSDEDELDGFQLD
jgi:hypothetical protein